LSGNCNPDSIYSCKEPGAQAKVYGSQCPAGHCIIESATTGSDIPYFDYCNRWWDYRPTEDIALAVREEVVSDDESSSKPDCSSHSTGPVEEFCRDLVKVTVIVERKEAITESIHGACADCCTCLHESSFLCGSRDESTSKADTVLPEYCCSACLFQCQGGNIPTMIYQRPTHPCYKFSKLDHDSLNKIDVDKRDESVTALVTNPLPVCICGKDSGLFCGDWATDGCNEEKRTESLDRELYCGCPLLLQIFRLGIPSSCSGLVWPLP
jgi:hypothetical protein